ncbi:MAG: polysaccharide deacetylase family protein [Acidimicrobiales bacterium]
MSATPVASLSIDVDNLWTYQMVHGNPDWERYGTYLPVLVDRLVPMFERHGLRITAFVVGKDVERPENADAISRLVEAGHEIENHSYRHQPWLHRYSSVELHEELEAAEAAIMRCGAPRPRGFRGPGYSLSEDTLRVLDARGYRYDCSTLPTVIGPLARAYYFRSAKLDAEQRAERAHLFGDWREGLRPLGAYRWELDGRPSLVELPVTTMPLVRVPIHVSYLLYLRGVSRELARRYLLAALAVAERRGVDVSLLLHPLDVLGPDDAEELSFFPGMQLPLATKVDLVEQVLTDLTARRTVVPIGRHVELIGGRELPLRPASGAGPRVGAEPIVAGRGGPHRPAPLEGARHG